MKKVMIIGIDSLEPGLLARFGEVLPNFNTLRRSSPSIKLHSIFPPDTIPAWATIFTGLNPARHGLIYAADVFGSSWQTISTIDVNIFKGNTFWDIAGGSGRRVGVVLPKLAYPPWPVNGAMVSRSMENRCATYPDELYSRYDVAAVEGFAGLHPGMNKLHLLAADVRRVALAESRIALQVSQDMDWDLFFVYFGWLDTIQHFFWRFWDETDPTYPGPGPYENVIREFYQLHDRMVGDLMHAHPHSVTIVLSDHGHGMRPPKTVNINEYLRQNGLLVSRGGRLNLAPVVLERVKRQVLDFSHQHELDYWLMRLATKTPLLRSQTKAIYTSESSIDVEKTQAQLSAFMGPKSYSYGGIVIQLDHVENSTYERLRERVINALTELREPRTGQKLVLWARRREEIYAGEFISRYPDVVFELEEGYGVHWGIHCPLIGTAYEHNLASGGHKKEAVFLASNLDRSVSRHDMVLMDVAPSILDLLGIKSGKEFDGRSIFK